MYIHLLLLGFAALSSAQVTVSGQLSVDYSVLNDDSGRTPCEMEATIKSGCPESAQSKRQAELNRRIPVHLRDAKGFDDHAPTANSCTCNNLFFNVWSACLMSQGNGSWVCSSSTWEARCQAQSLAVETIPYNITSPLPPWAYHTMPNNASFDILAAVSTAESDEHSASSNLQIVIPVVVGVSTVLLGFVCFWIYRRRHNMDPTTSKTSPGDQGRQGRFNLGGLLLGARKVRITSRDKSWEIDHDDPESFELISTPRSGHFRLHSGSSVQPLYVDFDTGTSKQPAWVVPGRSLWRGAGKVLMFWKPGPVRVKSRHPDRRFDIDAVHSDEKTRSKLRKSRPQDHRTNTSQYEITGPVFEQDDDSDVEDDRIVTAVDTFNSSNPPSVILISHRGPDFTVESGETASEQIVVVPPSPSEESQFPPIPPPPISGQRSRPIAPPAPNYPAPLPPTSPRHDASPSSQPTPLPQTHVDPQAPPHTRQLSNESTTSLNSRASRRLPQPPIARNPSRETIRRPVTPSQNVSPRSRPLPLRPSFEELNAPAPPYNPQPRGHESVLASSPIQHHRLLSEEQLSSPVHQRMLSDESHVEPAVLFAGPVRAAGYMSPVNSSDSLNLIHDH